MLVFIVGCRRRHCSSLSVVIVFPLRHCLVGCCVIGYHHHQGWLSWWWRSSSSSSWMGVVLDFVCSFVCLFIHLFIHSFVHSFIHSFVCLFVRLFVCVCLVLHHSRRHVTFLSSIISSQSSMSLTLSSSCHRHSCCRHYHLVIIIVIAVQACPLGMHQFKRLVVESKIEAFVIVVVVFVVRHPPRPRPRSRPCHCHLHRHHLVGCCVALTSPLSYSWLLIAIHHSPPTDYPPLHGFSLTCSTSMQEQSRRDTIAR